MNYTYCWDPFDFQNVIHKGLPSPLIHNKIHFTIVKQMLIESNILWFLKTAFLW